MPPSSTREYLPGITGHYRCRTVREVEKHIGNLHSQIADASPERRAHLWWDIDLLIDRRSAMIRGER